ncbi:MAG: BRO family protein [Moraxella sp.]|nr:BRO family protein [Moraxella sp.]
MSNQISTFIYETLTVRTATNNQDGSIWFCLPDVANVLEIQNSRDIVAKQLDKAGVEKIYISHESGKKLATFISEPNLYRVIFRSNKAEAVKFQNWVFDEVLPSIRKTGQYRHTISTEQQAQIQKCVRQKCKDNSTHYQTVYTALKDKFGVPSYKDILATDFKSALAFINTFALPQYSEHNAFWRMVGILEYNRLSDELTELQDSLDAVQRKLNHIVKNKGLLYDSLGEQRHPYNPNTLADATAFIERQMARKKQLGLIS